MTRSKVLIGFLTDIFTVLKTDYSFKMYQITLIFPSDSLESSWENVNSRLSEVSSLLENYAFLSFLLLK